MSPMLVRLAHGFSSLAGERWATVRPVTGADEVLLAADTSVGSEPWLDTAAAAVTTVADTPVTVADVSSLSVGDRNAIILGLLAASYGPRLSWVHECDGCGERFDIEAAIASLLDVDVEPVDQSTPFRLPTSADLARLSGADPDLAREELLHLCIPDVETLDDSTVAAIEEAMSNADPLADIALTLTCESCGAITNASVDLGAELLARLASESALIQDVHALALAYGWSESEVFALSRPHRRDYLTLLADLAS